MSWQRTTSACVRLFTAAGERIKIKNNVQRQEMFLIHSTAAPQHRPCVAMRVLPRQKKEKKKTPLDLIPWFSVDAPDVQRWSGLPLLRADWTDWDAVEREWSAHCWGRQRRCRELDGRESKVAYLWEVKCI